MKYLAILLVVVVLAGVATAQPSVSLTINEESVFNGQRVTLQADEEHVAVGRGSEGVDRVLLLLHGQNLRSQDTPRLEFTLNSGTHELDIIGFQDNRQVTSAKIFLLVSETPNCQENWQCTEWDACEEDCGATTHTRVCMDQANCGYRTSPRTEWRTIVDDQEIPPPDTEEDEDRPGTGFVSECNALEQSGGRSTFNVAGLLIGISFGEDDITLASEEVISFAHTPQKLQIMYTEEHVPRAQELWEDEYEYKALTNFCRTIYAYIQQLTQEQPDTRACEPELSAELERVFATEHSNAQRRAVIERILEHASCERPAQEASLKIRAAQRYVLLDEHTLTVETLRRISEEYEQSAPEQALLAKYLQILRLPQGTTCGQLFTEIQKYHEIRETHQLQPGSAQLDSLTILQQRCVSQRDNCKLVEGEESAPIRFLFIPDGFESQELFENMVSSATAAFGMNSLLRENRELFSFSVLTDLSLSTCEDSDTYDVCTREDARPFQRICGGSPIVLSMKDFRSFAYSGEISFVSAIRIRQLRGQEVRVQREFLPQITLHEIGHSYFGLPDEYTEDELGRRSATFPCQHSLEDAQRAWQDIPDAEFHSGCAYVEENYRSSYNSIMRYHTQSVEFSPAARVQVQHHLDTARRSGR